MVSCPVDGKEENEITLYVTSVVWTPARLLLQIVVAAKEQNIVTCNLFIDIEEHR